MWSRTPALRQRQIRSRRYGHVRSLYFEGLQDYTLSGSRLIPEAYNMVLPLLFGNLFGMLWSIVVRGDGGSGRIGGVVRW